MHSSCFRASSAFMVPSFNSAFLGNNLYPHTKHADSFRSDNAYTHCSESGMRYTIGLFSNPKHFRLFVDIHEAPHRAPASAQPGVIELDPSSSRFQAALALANIREVQRALSDRPAYKELSTDNRIALARAIAFGERLPQLPGIGTVLETQRLSKYHAYSNLEGIGHFSLTGKPNSYEIFKLYNALQRLRSQLTAMDLSPKDAEVWAAWALLEANPHKPPLMSKLSGDWIKRHGIGSRLPEDPLSGDTRSAFRKIHETVTFFHAKHRSPQSI